MECGQIDPCTWNVLPTFTTERNINQIWVNAPHRNRVGYRCYSSPNHNMLLSSKRQRAEKAAQVLRYFAESFRQQQILVYSLGYIYKWFHPKNKWGAFLMLGMLIQFYEWYFADVFLIQVCLSPKNLQSYLRVWSYEFESGAICLGLQVPHCFAICKGPGFDVPKSGNRQICWITRWLKKSPPLRMLKSWNMGSLGELCPSTVSLESNQRIVHWWFATCWFRI